MNWGVLGQTVTVWLIVGAIAAPIAGRAIKSWKTKHHFQALIDNAKGPARKEEQALVNRELLIATMVDEQKQNAQTAEWQERARRAEGLGFKEPEDPWAA